MKLRHLLSLLATGSLLSVASAQYTSNDFSTDNIGLLGQYSLGGTNAGTWTVTGGQLEYTSSLANTSRVLMMNNATNSAYTEDWTASLTVTNQSNLSSAGYSLIGLQVFAANDLNYGLFGAYALNNFTSGQNLLVEKGLGPTYTLTSYVENPAITDLTDLTLRMTHNAATHDITISYSNDGATFYDSIVFNPSTDWSGAPIDGFSFRILALSSFDQIGAGQMYADNFAVSAIPEPSTYAALAGLGALSLAIWRRRQMKSAA